MTWTLLQTKRGRPKKISAAYVSFDEIIKIDE